MQNDSPHFIQAAYNEMGACGAAAVATGCQPKASNINFYSGAGTIAGDSSVYIGEGNYGGSFAAVAMTISAAGIIRNLVAAPLCDPGTGETYTYTLYVNDAATALACAVTHGSVYGPGTTGATDMTDWAEVNAGDRVAVKVVTSATAAATYHEASVLLQQ